MRAILGSTQSPQLTTGDYVNCAAGHPPRSAPLTGIRWYPASLPWLLQQKSLCASESHPSRQGMTPTSCLFPFLSGCEIKETPKLQPKSMPPSTTQALSEPWEPSQALHLLCSLPSACWGPQSSPGPTGSPKGCGEAQTSGDEPSCSPASSSGFGHHMLPLLVPVSGAESRAQADMTFCVM